VPGARGPGTGARATASAATVSSVRVWIVPGVARAT
jgi:hypothetical protein